MKKTLLLILCALYVFVLYAVDDRFLTKISHQTGRQAFKIDARDEKAIISNQSQVWIYSVFNPFRPQTDASYYSVFPIEDFELMAAKYLFVSSKAPTNSLLQVDSLNVYGKIFFPNTLIGDRINREGSTIYISDHNRGIEIIDIGSGALRETKSVFSEKWGIRDFIAAYPYIYALNDFGVITVDVSDLRMPVSIGRNYQMSNASVIAKNGDILWIGAGKLLVAINISDLNNPTLLNQYRLAYDILDIEIKDNRLFTALGTGGVRIFSIANPHRIEEINSISLPAAYDLALDKTFIYIAAGNAGWFIYEYR